MARCTVPLLFLLLAGCGRPFQGEPDWKAITPLLPGGATLDWKYRLDDDAKTVTTLRSLLGDKGVYADSGKLYTRMGREIRFFVPIELGWSKNIDQRHTPEEMQFFHKRVADQRAEMEALRSQNIEVILLSPTR